MNLFHIQKNVLTMTHNIMESNVNYKEAQLATKQYDKSHGSFFDRGSADSYYGRERNPHRGDVGGFFRIARAIPLDGLRIDAITEAELEAYHAGYDYNEQYGDRKSWD